MPLKLKRKFEAEYGKKKGDRIFYAWENKHGHLYPRHHSSASKLILTGDRTRMRRMFTHLKKEHPSVRGHIKLI